MTKFSWFPQIRNKYKSVYIKCTTSKKAENTVFSTKTLDTPVSGKSCTEIYVLHSPLKSKSQVKKKSSFWVENSKGRWATLTQELVGHCCTNTIGFFLPWESTELAKCCNVCTWGWPVWRKCGIGRVMQYVHRSDCPTKTFFLLWTARKIGI